MTLNLKNKDVHEATKYKQMLEQRQREEAKQRQETGAKIQHKVGGRQSDFSLSQRLFCV